LAFRSVQILTVKNKPTVMTESCPGWARFRAPPIGEH